MPNIILPEKKLMFSFNKETDEICKPLQTLGITFFNYLRIYRDGSRIDLNNHAGITDYYYYKSHAYQGQAVEWDPFSLQGKLFFWSDFEDKAWKVIRDEFDVANGITFLEKNNKVCELYHFAAERNNHKIISFYLNNQDVLKLFILYFKDKAAQLIRRAEQKKIKIIDYNKYVPSSTDILKEFFRDKEKAKDFINKLDINKYYLGGNFGDTHLTKKEIECLKWCGKGKSAEEIAAILNISKRTCETHLEHIKAKLGCYKQLSLGYLIAKLLPEIFFE